MPGGSQLRAGQLGRWGERRGGGKACSSSELAAATGLAASLLSSWNVVECQSGNMSRQGKTPAWAREAERSSPGHPSALRTHTWMLGRGVGSPPPPARSPPSPATRIASCSLRPRAPGGEVRQPHLFRKQPCPFLPRGEDRIAQRAWLACVNSGKGCGEHLGWFFGMQLGGRGQVGFLRPHCKAQLLPFLGYQLSLPPPLFGL